jgi:hypothetical protein
VLVASRLWQPEEFVASLAAHCLHLRTVIDIDQLMQLGRHWKAHVSRPDGIVSVRLETRIADIFDRHMWDD